MPLIQTGVPYPGRTPPVLRSRPNHDGTAHLRCHLFRSTDVHNGLMAEGYGIRQLLRLDCVRRAQTLKRDIDGDAAGLGSRHQTAHAVCDDGDSTL